VTDRVTSADGTTIVFDRSGDGPAVILVPGAFTDRCTPSCLTWLRPCRRGSQSLTTTVAAGVR
jgi:hypothetical protein